MKSQVMTLAHQIKASFDNFSQALKAAWRIIKLKMGIRTKITFVKKTGEIREAVAIALGSLSTIEKGYVKFVELLEGGNSQWRSFRIQTLLV